MIPIILGERGSGKTTYLIKKSAETGIPILVPTYTRANYLIAQAKELGFDIPFPLTLTEHLNRRNNIFEFSPRFKNGIYIDQADDVLRLLFNKIEIREVTWTKEEVRPIAALERSVNYKRDELLICAGAIAAYQDVAGTICIPANEESQKKLANSIVEAVADYIMTVSDDEFEKYIRKTLEEEFPVVCETYEDDHESKEFDNR